MCVWLPFVAVRYLAEEIRSTLPADDKEAAPFVSGMAWMFLIQMVMLVVATWLWAASR